MAKKYQQVKRAVKKAYHNVKQAGKKIYNGAKQAKKAVNNVKDAYKKTAKWVKEHKAEIAGFVVGAVVDRLRRADRLDRCRRGRLGARPRGGSLVTGAMKGHTGMDLFKDALIGGTVGALTGGLFSVGGAARLRCAQRAQRCRGAFGRRHGGRRRPSRAGQHRARVDRRGQRALSAGNSAINNARNALRRPVGCAHSFDPGTRVLMTGRHDQTHQGRPNR